MVCVGGVGGVGCVGMWVVWCGYVGGVRGVGEWRGFQNADTDEQTDRQIHIPPLVQTK